MSESGYEIAHVDELDALPINGGEFVWRPVRRRFGISAFGTNAYTAEEPGQRLIEEHRESDGHEEMYVVLRGRATFELDDDEVDAPAGTIVYARPGTKRGAFAAEARTAVLAVGAKPGVLFEPSRWEDIFAASSYAELGELDRARSLVQGTLERWPDTWQGFYNAACIEARFGDPETAIAHLKRSVELDAESTKQAAAGDSDLDSIRERPDYPA
jgi:mannose-6-phosphate isomerase-like protein (cupin superfamily)